YDLHFEHQKHVTIEEYLNMIKGKTAALISGSLAIGAAVALAEEQTISQLQTIGQKAGIAFQIQDDLLDVVADPNKFGKMRGGDIQEGKKTYFLEHELSNHSITSYEISAVIDLFDKLDVIDDTEKMIRQYYKEAMNQVDAFRPSPYKRKLITFLNRLLSREF